MTKKMPQPARYEAQQRPCRAENCRETVSAVVALDDRGQEIEAVTTRPSFCEAHNQRLGHAPFARMGSYTEQR